MTMNDDHRPHDDGVYQSASDQRTAASGKRIAVWVAGAAVVLGVGSYAITTLVTGDDRSVTQDVNAVAPIAPAVSASPDAAEAPSAPSSSATASAGPTTTAPSKATASDATRAPNDAEVKKQIQAARDAAARDGIPLQRPLRSTGNEVAGSQAATRTEATSEGTIRITSARVDLAGQQDQLLAADKGAPAGHARCTQNFRFSSSQGPRRIPNMLLCWRTSAARSVVTLAVAKSGNPSTAFSTATIDREWAKLR